MFLKDRRLSALSCGEGLKLLNELVWLVQIKRKKGENKMNVNQTKTIIFLYNWKERLRLFYL